MPRSTSSRPIGCRLSYARYYEIVMDTACDARLVVIGLLGTTLDQGRGRRAGSGGGPRWHLCQHEDLLVDRLELLHAPQFTALAERSRPTSRSVSPETDGATARRRVRRPLGLRGGLRRAARLRARATLRARARGLPRPHHDRHARRADLPVPADRVAPSSRPAPPDLAARARRRRQRRARYAIIDLDLSRYDRIASRFQQEQREGVSFLKSGIETRNAALQPR